MTIPENIISEINKSIKNAKKLAIIGHFNPDGDAMGGSLGLFNILKKEKSDIKIIMPTSADSSINWLPSSQEILVHKNKKEEAENALLNADLIFCVDFNGTKRVENLQQTLEKASAVKVMLDHHPQPEDFCNFTISETSVSSASEVVYEFIVQSGRAEAIDKQIATCLFTGIMTDTLNFSVNSSKTRTFEIVSELLSKNINKDKIYDRVFNNYSFDRMRLAGYVLNKKMKLIPECKSAYIILSQKEFKEYNYQSGDQDGFVNFPLSIKGVNVSCFFMENDDFIKVSLRSKGNYDVNAFARKYFGGGGHKNASGGRFFGKIEEIEELIVKYLEDFNTKN